MGDCFKKCMGYDKDGNVIDQLEEKRDRWSSNSTFIMAAIGSAIGLGNLWRFPYLCFKWGGATFFIPYFICLFFLGIPMIMLEFAIGQTLQKGNIIVWRMLHPQLYGVGLATCVACYLICIYYNVIISWSAVLFFSGFFNPLPWSVLYADNGINKVCDGTNGGEKIYISEEFFYRDILHTYNDDCTIYDTKSTMGDFTVFQWQVFLSQMLVWACCFVCVFQGVKLSSKVVWVTVPLPVVFVFIMVMNGFTLNNCDQGFRMYLKGHEMQGLEAGDFVTETPPNIQEKLSSAGMWSEACAQIFFTLSICIGVMISYSSYNPVDAPIISNAFTVSFCNCGFSFFAGFAVFSTVGYLYGLESIVAGKVSSIGLAFVAYPAAIETMPAPNFWTLLLAITLFTLGIDSAFAMVEASATVVQDSALGKKLSKFVIAFILCVAGSVMSTVFCFNWGFTFFDVIDHYLNVYLVLLMGILQSVCAAWIHCIDDSLHLSMGATLFNIIGYFLPLLVLPWACYFGFPESSWIGLPIIWGWYVLMVPISFMIAKFANGVGFKQWYGEIFLYGVRPIARKMISLNESKMGSFRAHLFEFWWGVSIKYVFPWAMYWLLVMTVQADALAPYGGYYWGWQVIGGLVPIAGLFVFLIPIFVNCGKKSDNSFYNAFKIVDSEKVAAEPAVTQDRGEVQMAELEPEQK